MQTLIKLDSVIHLTQEQFYAICADNPELKLERNFTGEVLIMSPTGGETGARNSDLNLELGIWNRQKRLGIVFDSSTGFTLPNGADRSPDLAWIPLAKWEALSPEQRSRFLPLCPDFVVELLSPTDSWTKAQAKMTEYQENGCRLGWLIDPKSRKVAIYRQGTIEIQQQPSLLLGENVLPGLAIATSLLW
jgi:Uma2 family endonuclease